MLQKMCGKRLLRCVCLSSGPSKFICLVAMQRNPNPKDFTAAANITASRYLMDDIIICPI